MPSEIKWKFENAIEVKSYAICDAWLRVYCFTLLSKIFALENVYYSILKGVRLFDFLYKYLGSLTF